VRHLALAFALCFAACSEDPVYTCPPARTTLTGSCTLGQRCAWTDYDGGVVPVDGGRDAGAAYEYACTCAGAGKLGGWMCYRFRRTNPANDCSLTLPAGGEVCDDPTRSGCFYDGVDGCRYRCDCVPMLGVITPPRWSCSRTCPPDAAVRDAPAGG
jgi:hypothetical protein